MVAALLIAIITEAVENYVSITDAGCADEATAGMEAVQVVSGLVLGLAFARVILTRTPPVERETDGAESEDEDYTVNATRAVASSAADSTATTEDSAASEQSQQNHVKRSEATHALTVRDSAFVVGGLCVGFASYRRLTRQA